MGEAGEAGEVAGAVSSLGRARARGPCERLGSPATLERPLTSYPHGGPTAAAPHTTLPSTWAPTGTQGRCGHRHPRHHHTHTYTDPLPTPIDPPRPTPPYVGWTPQEQRDPRRDPAGTGASAHTHLHKDEGLYRHMGSTHAYLPPHQWGPTTGTPARLGDPTCTPPPHACYPGTHQRPPTHVRDTRALGKPSHTAPHADRGPRLP